MDDIIKVLKQYLKLSPLMLIMLFVVKMIIGESYTQIKDHLDRIDKANAAIKDDIRKTSLDIKKDLRGEESAALVQYRLALEEWQEFMLNGPFEFVMSEKGLSIEDLAQ